ncbi:MAG: DUF6165 family protein [Wenzhouxiangellaceae bacterium]
MQTIHIPVSPGELLDKITILQIKQQRFSDRAKLANVAHELALLEQVWRDSGADNPQVAGLISQLREINELLWQVEDDIRDKEAVRAFDDDFIHLARSVYRHNDRRAALKKEINLLLGSDLVEEKGYQAY